MKLQRKIGSPLLCELSGNTKESFLLVVISYDSFVACFTPVIYRDRQGCFPLSKSLERSLILTRPHFWQYHHLNPHYWVIGSFFEGKGSLPFWVVGQMRSLGPGPKIADRVGVGKLTEDFQDGFLPLSTTDCSGYIKTPAFQSIHHQWLQVVARLWY